MTSAVESIKPLVAWCDVPPPANVGDTHIVRFYLAERSPTGLLPLYYYGTLAFKRGPGQPRFDGTAVASVDPRFDPIALNRDFKEWFVKVGMVLVFSGVVSLFVTFCDWDNNTLSAGAELRTVEADKVDPSGDTSFRVLLDGRTWQMVLRRSTVKGF